MAQRVVGRALQLEQPGWAEETRAIPLGAVTELVCTAPSCGSQLWLEQLLLSTRQAGQRAALIDAGDGFDPESFPPELLEHLVWVRCPSLPIALQVTDLLAHDANLSLLVLDLRHSAETELRRTPARTWYRLQRAAEPADLALVVTTSRVVVPSAQLRLQLERSHALDALQAERPELIAQLQPQVQRQRVAQRLAV